MMVCRSCSGEDDRLFRYMAVSHLFPVSYVHTSLFGDPCESACLSVSVWRRYGVVPNVDVDVVVVVIVVSNWHEAGV
jgi:hypothetical protein